MWQVLQVVSGGIITIGTAVLIEYLRRPRLQFSIEEPPFEEPFGEGLPARDRRNLRLMLSNRSPRFGGRRLQRQAALQCRGAITFHHLDDGQDVFGGAMPVRWANSPEPIPLEGIAPDGGRFLIFDPVRFTTDSRIDIYPGDNAQPLDVAARYDNDEDCYGWNSERYPLALNLRNPAWRLPPGRYLVRVEVTSSGQKCVRIFRLINDVARAYFRLEPSTPDDSQRLGGAR
jgi:hypothetical protein